MNQRIIWLQDEVKLLTPQNLWGDVDMANERLIAQIQHPDFDHVIIDPSESLQNLTSKLEGNKFSCIIDLSGFLNENIKEFWPDVKVVNSFHISRVRKVSSPKLDGSGFLSSLTPDELNNLKAHLDLAHPLILDDIAWSGRTTREAIRMFGMNPSTTTFGSLVLNIGNFGESRPGAAQLLEKEGIQVAAGHFVASPDDDTFHLKDFFDHIFIKNPRLFEVITTVQELRERAALSSQLKQKAINQEIKHIFLTERHLLFPSARDTSEMKKAQEEGRLVLFGSLPKESLFDINPLIWLTPSFSKRINSAILKAHQREISETLRELKSTVERNREPTREQVRELLLDFDFRTGIERLY